MGTREHGSVLLGRYLDGPPKRSQAELAEVVGVRQQTISRWRKGEDGPVDFDTQIRIEDATGGAVPVESWLSDEAAQSFAVRLRERRAAKRTAQRVQGAA